MRPYKNGESPSRSTRKQKKLSNGTRGGVKKAVVKAKVNAVKTKRKIASNENTKDEIDGLIERAANDPSMNGSYMEFTPTRSNPKGRKGIARATHQLRKVKSMVKHNSHSKLEEEPETPRRSTRNRNGASTSGANTNGVSNGLNQSYDEVGLEASETTTMSNGSQGPGLLKRTISKIWKMPNEVNSVASYDSMESQETQNGHEEKDTSRSSCVIS